ncbi:hypothetical protein [Natrialba swarupiae]|nr:hypothetical protein [Natrialba swarupiae]
MAQQYFGWQWYRRVLRLLYIADGVIGDVGMEVRGAPGDEVVEELD